MQHIHDSRLQLRELHCAGLLDEAAQVRLAAQAGGQAPVGSRLAAWRARFSGATDALIHRLRLPFSTTARPAARPSLFRERRHA